MIRFQIGGWNVGVKEYTSGDFLPLCLYRYANKLDYARYTNLKIYEGTSKQAFELMR